MDRAEVILDIFSTRARSHEAKLQVELAQLEYLLPRLTRMWTHLSRIRGGIGLRGPGETQLETDRRSIRQQIQGLKAQAEGRREAPGKPARRPGSDAERRAGGLHQRRQVQHPARAVRAARDRGGRPALRDARHPHARSRSGRGPAGPLTDTVGFIRKLPHHLVASFRATLEEVRGADVLLHVVDASHPDWEGQMRVVERVLAELELADRP